MSDWVGITNQEIETLREMAMSVKTDNTQTLVNALAEIERLRGHNSMLDEALTDMTNQVERDASMGLGTITSGCVEFALDAMHDPKPAAWLLRKQAEAVEAEALEWPEDKYKECSHVRLSILESAKELIEKADELEAGGDE